MGVPIYPSDFAPEPVSAYDPTAGDLFFNLPLSVLAALLLAGIAIAVAAYWAGQNRREPGDGCEAIWKAVSKAIEGAVAAPRDQVVAKGRALSETLQRELGPILTFAGPLVGPCARLKAAVDGKGEGGHDAHSGGHGGDDHGPSRIDRMVIHARKVTINAAEAGDGHADHDDHGHGDAAHGDHGHGKSLSYDEQIAAVRQAVHALSDHWSAKSARLGELRAIRRRLNASGAASTGPRLSKA